MPQENEHHHAYAFGEYILDLDRGALQRNGVDVRLRPKSFAVLTELVVHHGCLVSKRALLDAVWGHTSLTEGALTQCLIEIRRALGDDSRELIRTVPRRGFIFDAPVTHCNGGPAGKAVSNSSTAQIGGIRIGTSSGDASTQERISRSPGARSALAEIKQHKFASVALLGLLMLAAAGYGYFFLDGSTRSAITSVAVLPFENGSGDPDMDYLSDGLSERLIDKLSQVPELKVIARTSSFKYRDPNVDLADVANKLRVGAIVTGRVTKLGDQLIVRAELVAVGENKQLWGEQYDRRASDAVALQHEIAMSISHNLRLKLTGAQEKDVAGSGAVGPEAYELLLKGEYWSGKPWSPEHARKAHQFYEQAVIVEPGYALAWAELSQSYGSLAVNTLADPKEVLPKAEAAALKAIELDEKLPEGHMAYGAWLKHQWRWREAEAELRRAVDLNPNFSEARMAYSQLLIVIGRPDDAIREAELALELDPLSGSANRSVGFIYNLARRYDEQLAVVQKALELDANNSYAHLLLAYYYLDEGMYREAINAFLQAIELGDDSTTTQIYLGTAYARAGENAKALAILKQLQDTKEYVSPAELPALLIALGMKDEAFASFEQAIATHDLEMQFLKVDSSFDPLRDDPRFADLVRRVGLPQ